MVTKKNRNFSLTKDRFIKNGELILDYPPNDNFEEKTQASAGKFLSDVRKKGASKILSTHIALDLRKHQPTLEQACEILLIEAMGAIRDILYTYEVMLELEGGEE